MRNQLLKKCIIFFFSIIALAVAFTTMSFAAESTEYVTKAYVYQNDTWKSADVYIKYTNSVEFTGEKVTPTASLWYELDGIKHFLEKDKDYIFTYETGIYPEYSYDIDIEFIDGQYIEFDRYYYWNSYNITYDATKVRVDTIPSYTYEGEYIRPTPNVYYGDMLLSKDKIDYYYYDNYNAGTAYVNIYISCLEYETEKTFKINKCPASKLTFGQIKDQIYAGYGLEPSVSVKHGKKSVWEYNESYKNNTNVGTGSVTLKFYGNYTGTKTIEFNILPVSLSKFEVYYSAYNTYYTGKAVKPTVYDAYYNGLYLDAGTDFTVSYSNNVKPGTATITLKAKNPNVTGSKKITFKITVESPYYFNVTTVGNTANLNWGYCSPSSIEYQVYKYDDASKAYVKIKTTKSTTFTDKDIAQYKTYKYKVRSRLKIDDTYYYSPYAEYTLKVTLFAPSKLTLQTKAGEIIAKWDKNSKAKGYYLYRYDRKTDTTKKVFTAKTNTELTYTDKSVKNYNPYSYYIVAYGTKDGKDVKSAKSTYVDSLSMASITRGAKLSQKTSYKIYNTQGSKTTLSSTINISKTDMNTLKKFADKYFKDDMPKYERVSYTLDWIHDKVTYAKGSNWDKISGKTYIDAIFNYKLGQCAQYNGALAGMMCYLGYDVQMIKGYRQSRSSGSKIQHFWTECKINGLTYVMECGNNKDGSWHYTFVPYNDTQGYTKNGKYISGR